MLRSITRTILVSALISTPIIAHAQARPAATPPLSSTEMGTLLKTMSRRGEIKSKDLAILQSKLPSFNAQSMVKQPHCSLPRLMAARRWIHEQGVAIQPAPPNSIGFVESKIYPIRVFYNVDTDKPAANVALEWAETSWKEQVTGMGYFAPFTDDDQGVPGPGIWIYIGDTGMGGGGYTEWLSDIPSTERSDCSARIVVDQLNTESDIPEIVYHEFNHATQMATDCAEAVSAWENFATTAEYLRFPDSYYFTGGFLPEFQKYPHYAVDFWTDNMSNDSVPLMYYQYGAGLFPLFLHEALGKQDPTFLPKLWQSFQQNGKITVHAWGPDVDTGNSPDWFVGTNTFLAGKGSSFQSAFGTFTEWRAVAGTYDDGQHFSRGTDFTEAMVAYTAGPKFPAEGTGAAREYGSSYIEFNRGSYPGKLELSLDVDAKASWIASMLVWSKDKAVQAIPIAIADAKAKILLPEKGPTRILIAVTQLSDFSHRPDSMDYKNSRSFTYRIADPDVPVIPDAGPDSADLDAGKDVSNDVVESDTSQQGMDIAGYELAGGGCGCRLISTDRPLNVASFGLLGFAGLLLRRRPLSRSRVRPF